MNWESLIAKTLCCVALSLGANIYARTIEVSDLKTGECVLSTITQPGNPDRTEKRGFSAEAYVINDSDLGIRVNNFLAECDGEYEITAVCDGRHITINPAITNPSENPCFCRSEMSFKLHNVYSGDGEYIIDWEGQPEENGVLPFIFENDYAKATGFYNDAVEMFPLRENYAVLFNPGNETYEPFFVHIGIASFDDGTTKLWWQDSPCGTIELGTLYTLGNEVYVHPNDVKIPSTFWGIGMECEYYNPYEILGGKDVKLYDYGDYNSETIYAFDFLKGITDGLRRENVYTTAEYDLLKQKSESHSDKYIWRDIRHDFSGIVSGSHHRHLGAIGAEYASNPIYPVYFVPEGAIPTSFSHLVVESCFVHGGFLWSYYDGDKLYDDKYFNRTSVDETSAVPDVRLIDGNLTVTSPGHLEVSVYSADGNLVARGSGNDQLKIALDSKSSFPAIVCIFTSKGKFVAKLGS